MTEIEQNLRLKIPLKIAKEIEEAITEFNNVIKRRLGTQQQTTNLKRNVRNTHGKSRAKLR
jgi:hypothetical protein